MSKKMSLSSLKLNNLSYSYSENHLPILDRFSCKVEEGEFIHFKGPNGCGKTTLLMILAHLKEPDFGFIEWSGQEITTETRGAYRKQLHFISDKPQFPFELKVKHLTKFYQRVLDTTQEPDLLYQKLSPEQDCVDLSYGQKKLLNLIPLFLSPDRPIWILDEPFNGLDDENVGWLENICLGHLKKDGILIMAQHQSAQNIFKRARVVTVGPKCQVDQEE